ncbi:MAG: hypothetical protein M3174_03130 [Actinomycetota bacterium]|nr:hypothetical protein [Actinomycetota bacterium]
MRRIATIGICLAFLSTACTGDESVRRDSSTPAKAPAPDPGAPARLAQALRDDFSEATVDAGLEAFARAGIGVFDDDSGTLVQEVAGGPSAFRYTAYQIRNLSLETSAGGGYRGSDLDALGLLQHEKLPTVSQMLVNYATKVDTFGAQLSAELLADQDLMAPENVVFPNIVIAMFLADVYPREPAEGETADSGEVVLAAGSSPLVVTQEEFPDELDPLTDEGWRDDEEDTDRGVCGAVQDFFNNVGEIASGAIGPVATGTLRRALGRIVERIPGLAEVRRANAILTTLVQAASVLRTWEIEMEVVPEETAHYSVAGDVVTGSFTAHVTDGGGFDPPAWLDACAGLVGLDLPESEDAPGSEVTWVKEGIPPHAEVVHEDATVQETSKAVLDFEMTEETEEDHASGELQEGEILVTATVKRNDTRTLSPTIETLLADASGEARAVVEAAAPDLLAELAELLDPTGSAMLPVEYHAPQSATIEWEREGASFSAYSCTGPRGPWMGTLVHTAGGSSSFEFEFPEDSNTTDVTISVGTPVGTLTFSGTATLTGDAIEFTGDTTVPGGGGGGTAVAPIEYGPVEECE